MHQCPKCKTEFGGRFCPECGLEWNDEKICPKCGAKSSGSARFCEACGYSFVPTEQSSPQEHFGQNTTKSAQSITQESLRQSATVPVGAQTVKNDLATRPTALFTVTKYMPMFLLIVFAILMLIFFSVNVAVMPGMTAMGVPLPATDYGSIFGGILGNMPEITSIVVALIVFTSIAFIYAIACIVTLKKKQLKDYRILYLGKYDLLLFEVLSILSPLIYIVFIVLGGVLMGKLNSLDGGTGLVEIDTYPKLLLIFSIVFFVVSTVAAIVRLAKYYDFLNCGGSMSVSRRNELAEFYATHTPPEEIKVSVSYAPKQVIAYKYDKHRYDNGKEGKTSAAVIWFDYHRTAIFFIGFILTIVVVLLATLIPYNMNIFRASKVEKIELGYTRQQVEDILGKPYDESKGESGFGDWLIGNVSGDTTDNKTLVRWRYFSKDYAKMRKEAEAQLDMLGLKGSMDAVISGGLGGMIGSAIGMSTILVTLYSKVYDYIEVDFDLIDNEYKVVCVILEKSRCDANSNKKREIKSASANIKDGDYYYEDFTLQSDNFKTLGESKKYQSDYTTYFEGGSFIRSYINNFKYSKADNESKVTWSDTYAEYTKPSDIKRLGHVTAGGVWFNDYSLEVVDYLPSTVKQIGDRSFKNSGLSRVEIPTGVTSIGNGAFTNCSNLTSIEIPTGVTSIGDNAFQDCSSLSSIEIPNSVTRIGNNAFSGCTNLSSITLPNNVTSIGDSSFQGCSSLSSIEIPNSVTRIGNNAFYDCSSLSSITIPNNVTNIGKNAFYNCSSLTSIEMPSGITSIGSEAFYNCENITTATMPTIAISYIPIAKLQAVVINGGTSIGNSAFKGCSSLTSITILNSVTSIDNFAFYNCSSLTSIEIPSSVTSIGFRTFGGCSKLTSIEIPNSVTSIGDSAFQGCSSLSSVEIPNSVTRIGNNAFYDCSSLSSITIPNNVTDIGKSAFYNCSSLTSIEMSSSITSIGSEAFYNCGNITTATMPTIAIPYIPKAKLQAVVINGGTNIEREAFSGCGSLTSIVIPNSVTSIGSKAFSDCSSLTNIAIPDSVINIGNYAFYNCSSLTIYCEVASKPSGWNSNWNYGNCPVVWSYKNR